jgi:uncharacterized membrane protein YhdT
MWKVLVQIFKLMLPIGTQNDPNAQNSWRWAISIVLLLVIVCGWLAILYATGKLLGSSGYVQHAELQQITSAIAAKAPAADLQMLTKSVSSIDSSVKFLTRESIEAAIRAKLTTACKTKDHEFKVELDQEVMQLEDRYYTLTGQGYQQPQCQEL